MEENAKRKPFNKKKGTSKDTAQVGELAQQVESLQISFNAAEWVPIKYQIQLQFEPNASHFTGVVQMNFQVHHPVKSIMLDAITTDVKVIDTNAQQGKWKGQVKTHEDPSQKRLKVVFPDALNANERAMLTIKFRSSIREDGLGVYSCGVPAKTTSGSAPMIASHFEPCFAALCFPCIVDPAIRCEFSLRILAPQGLTVLSCMPWADQPTADAKMSSMTLYSFETTPPIPAYLLCFAMGHFTMEEFTFRSLAGEIPVRTYVPLGYYTSDVMVKSISQELKSSALSSLQFLEQYFQVPLWTPKIDFVAVPHMLLAGMEHLGCCFLHVMPGTDDITSTSLANDVFHEVAHQWVGNLVGFSLKVKEGIVQYLEKAFTEKLFGGNSNKKNTRKKAQHGHGTTTLTNKKLAGNSMTSQLLKDFYRELNEEFYQKSLKTVETVVEQCGEKAFQQRLTTVLQEYSEKFMDDSAADISLFAK